MSSFLKRDLVASRRFKAKLRSGERATLINASHPSPSLVEKLAHLGFDAVLIDAEHGSVGRERVEEMSRAAALAGTAAIIRPEGSFPHLVTGYLGCGVDGFMLPLIRSAAQARELAETFCFSAPLDHANRPLIMMVETIEAVEALPELLAIETVDAFLVAQWDLALSMGLALGPNAGIPAPAERKIDQAIETIVANGRTCGMRVAYDTLERYSAMGVTLFYDHADNMTALGARAFLDRLAGSPTYRR